MFKFRFSEESDNDDKPNKDDGLQWSPAVELFPTKQHILTAETVPVTNTFHCAGLTLLHIPAEDAIKQLPSHDSIVEAELLHSDLLPAKYEGGFKIWECTQDLAEYLLSESAGLHFSGSHVLDLGCGAGLLGIIAMSHGAVTHFQDYNVSVLNAITIPNILLSVEKEQREEKLLSCRFFAGDWKSFVDLTDSEDIKYDFILTSETIYNTNNYHKLCSVFKKRLKKTGVVYLAAKTYYFGVGGGLRQFEYILKTDGALTSSVCWKCSEGVQREILKITFTDDPANTQQCRLLPYLER